MDIGRAEYYAVTDAQALEAFQHVSKLEGIIPALETSHAFAYLKVRTPDTQAVPCPHSCQGRELFFPPTMRGRFGCPCEHM